MNEDVIKLKKSVYRILLTIFIAVFVISGYFLLVYFLESQEQQGQFEDLTNLVKYSQQQMPTDSPEAETQGADGEEGPVPAETSPQMTEVEDPDTGETISVLWDYANLYNLNSDVVGWMQIEGTKINYPVMQKPESVDYYLYRNFYKEDSTHGCLYVRETCDVEAPSDNVTIYGHKMKDGSMFAALHEYIEKAFWEKHRFIRFDTLKQYNTYEIISVFRTTASEDGFAYHEFVDASDEAEFNDYVATCKQLSLYDTGVTAEYGDKLITLSTCEYSQADGRLVVVAKQISE